MRFFVLKENLNKALLVANRCISTRPQLPILSNILLKTENNKLKISATNLELGISYNLGAKIEEHGETTIPGKLFTEFITNIQAEKLEVFLEGTKLLVKTKNTQATFATTNPVDFPPFPDIPKKRKKIPINKIKKPILRTVFAASTDETRPVLTGIRIKTEGEEIELAATDGYRLSVNKLKTADFKDILSVILPARSLTELVRVSTELNEEVVEFSTINGKNQVVFILPNIHIFTRIINGEFPNVEKIIPQKFKTKVTIEKNTFINAVKTVALFARGAANIVKVKIEKTGLWLSANTPQIGEDKDFIEAKVEGEESETAFNYRFLLDLLTNIPGDELVFETSGPLNPGVFKPTKADTFLHIIMPVRIQGNN